jgi:hypothetical protein
MTSSHDTILNAHFYGILGHYHGILGCKIPLNINSWIINTEGKFRQREWGRGVVLVGEGANLERSRHVRHSRTRGVALLLQRMRGELRHPRQPTHQAHGDPKPHHALVMVGRGGWHVKYVVAVV